MDHAGLGDGTRQSWLDYLRSVCKCRPFPHGRDRQPRQQSQEGLPRAASRTMPSRGRGKASTERLTPSGMASTERLACPLMSVPQDIAALARLPNQPRRSLLDPHPPLPRHLRQKALGSILSMALAWRRPTTRRFTRLPASDTTRLRFMAPTIALRAARSGAY